MSSFGITREIGIDAGHRVTYHGSKCRNVHGHRYRVLAHCVGELAEKGEQQGMVLDFGFLKEEMMAEIDAPCDHGLILWADDPLLNVLLPYPQYQQPRQACVDNGHHLTTCPTGKLYLVPFVPTAEHLAQHWFDRLAPRVAERSGQRARLEQIEVWETPNCRAIWPADAVQP